MEKKKIVGKFLQVFIGALLAVACVIYFYGQFVLKNSNSFNPICSRYDESWTVTYEDGSTEEIVAPVDLNLTKGETVSFSTQLPIDLSNDTVMILKTSRSFVAEVDGEEIYRYDASDRKFPGPVVKSYYFPIYLENSEAGKTLTISRFDKTSDNGVLNEVFIGNSIGVIYEILEQNAPQMVLSLLLLVFAVALFVVDLVIKRVYESAVPIGWMGLGLVLASVWCITDNYLYQFIFKNLYVDGATEYMMIMLMPCPFYAYINRIQKRRYETVFNLLNFILGIVFVVVTGLHFFGNTNFQESMGKMSAVVGLTFIVAVFLLVYDIFIKKHKGYFLQAVGFFGLIFFALVEMVLLNVFPISHKLDGLFYIIGLYFLLIMTLLHAVKRIKAMQRDANMAKEANRAKLNFLGRMSQEIRQPIQSMLTMSELIQSETNQTQIKGYAIKTQEAGATLLDLVNDILDFSKIEAGKMEIWPSSYSTGQLIEDIVVSTKGKAIQKGLSYTLDVAEDLPTALLGDQKRVREIAFNFVINAIRYTKEGGITLKIFGREEKEEFILCITISDTGIGIREEDRERVFSNFERIEREENKDIVGTGLGLSINKKLIQMMGGSVTMESQLGVGSTFAVELPQKIVDKTPLGEFNTNARDLYVAKLAGATKWSAFDLSAETPEYDNHVKESDLLDEKLGRLYCGNDEDFYHESLMIFAESKGQKKTDLAAYYAAEDWENYQICAHAVKSSAQTIGAIALSKRAGLLEEACRNGAYSYVRKNHTDFMKLYNEVVDEIGNRL